MKRLLLLLLFVLPIYSSAQITWKDKVNQLNEKGKKYGLWITEYNNRKVYEYYKDGKQHGPFYCVNTMNNTLVFSGEMFEDNYVNYNYYSDRGHLMTSMTNFQKNNTPVPKCHMEFFYSIPDFRCLCTDFHSNGAVGGVGTILFFSPDPIVYGREFGEWKYYDEEGELYEIKIFGDTITVLHPDDKGWHE